jgi:hypothetical protein
VSTAAEVLEVVFSGFGATCQLFIETLQDKDYKTTLATHPQRNTKRLVLHLTHPNS